ncbi:MAG TPA: sulfite exporter TauE/SafE family protein [Methylomirabilota bacterium]|nr:sulfite exporter TauE/SafE family protein [Methylomirabilota bacterium]
MTFLLALVVLSLAGAFVSGLVGVGGAIVMIPLLLYVPPLLDVGRLDVKTVTAVTMVQVFVAALSGVVAHGRRRAVRRDLAAIGGLAMASGSLTGAILSHFVDDRTLLVVFGLMTLSALALLFVPTETAGQPIFAERVEFNRPRAVLVCGGVGLAAGLVGAGGAFLLVPLLMVVVGLPIRVTIGSSLAITALAATAGVAGKIVTGQVPLMPTLAVVLGAVPGAQVGAMVSRRLSGSNLRRVLFVVTLGSAMRVWWDLLVQGSH